MTAHQAAGKLRGKRASLVVACCLIMISAGASSAEAQIGRGNSYPSDLYFATFGMFYDGDYERALNNFQREGRGGLKLPNARWVDSICYYTMTGECFYRMGRMNEARAQFEAALQLYLANSNFLIRVSFPASIRPAQPGEIVAVPWGQRQRTSGVGKYQTTYQIGQGRIDNSAQVRTGGVVQSAVLIPLNVEEIIRCVILSTRRWRQLSGPVAQYDPLTKDLIATLAARPGQPNHWTESWTDVMLGVAYLAAGQGPQAQTVLERSLLAGGQFDHPFTSTALLELGQLALDRGEHNLAAKYFEEATYCAVQYPDTGVLEEAFIGIVNNRLASGQTGLFESLPIAMEWSRLKDLRQLHVTLGILRAQNLLQVGNADQAASVLNDVRAAMSRQRIMFASRSGAQLEFASAQVAYHQGNIPAGDKSLTEAMKFQRSSGLWNYHIQLVDNFYASSRFTERNALELYALLLKDPSALGWMLQPMESLSLLMTPHGVSYANWFDLTVRRQANDEAMEIADRAKRAKFFATLPMGGRLLGLRWVLEAPATRMPQEAQLQKQNLLSRYPRYAELATQAQTIQQSLARMPLASADAEQFRNQSQLLKDLAANAHQREVILRQIALSHEPALLAFPPVQTSKQLRENLASNAAMITFYRSGKFYYAFAIYGQDYSHWQVGPEQTVGKQIATLLRDMGHLDGNRALPAANLTDNAWKQSSQGLFDLLFGDARRNYPLEAEELVIVPDGVLWYVPFEALIPSTSSDGEPLITKQRVRYAPLAGLGVSGDGPGRRPSPRTGVVAGRLYPRDGNEVSQAAADALSQIIPGTSTLATPLPGDSPLVASRLDRLIVLDDIQLNPENPFGWSPIQMDKAAAQGALDRWLLLPFAGPDEILLPGFHTAAEDGLKRVPKSLGDEVFISACGLMATGARTVLLSRWRPGGRSSFDLVREFVQELPHLPADEAWQRAVFMTTNTPLDPTQEPRLDSRGLDDPPPAKHPFFWAAYMLLDTGVAGPTADPPSPAGAAAVTSPADDLSSDADDAD